MGSRTFRELLIFFSLPNCDEKILSDLLILPLRDFVSSILIGLSNMLFVDVVGAQQNDSF